MIIGLSGLAGSGKTTVANILVKQHGFVRRPFAYPLKSMIASLGFDRDTLDGPAAGKEVPLEVFGGRTLREAMQTLGTEWGRNQFGDDIWVKLWLREANRLQRVVADDVRFANEAAAVRARGGIVVKLFREGAGTKSGAGHASENVDSVPEDLQLGNDGTIEELEAEIRGIVSAYDLYVRQQGIAS